MKYFSGHSKPVSAVIENRNSMLLANPYVLLRDVSNGASE